jgi:hypothetical protein
MFVLELEDGLASGALKQEDGANAIYGQVVVEATTAQGPFANCVSAALAEWQLYSGERLAA